MEVISQFFGNIFRLIVNQPGDRFILSMDWALFWFRVVIGTIFLVHGVQKLHYWEPGHTNAVFARYLFLFRVVSLLEIIAAASLFLGFFVHITVILLIGIMLGALYFKIVIWRKGFTGESGWELDLLLIAALIILFFFGGGLFSFDRKLPL